MVLIFIMLLISFLESTLSSVPWILLILIARSFLIQDRENFWLAFGFGLLLAILTGQNLGLLSLMYILVVASTYLAKARLLSSHWLQILPLTLVLMLITEGVLSIFFQSQFRLTSILIETALILPIYILITVWEERFVPKKDIRLRIGR